MSRRTSVSRCRRTTLAHLNRCLFWFHPLSWWLEKRLALTAEHAADDVALSSSGESRSYAEVLLDMAETVRHHRGRLAWQGVGVDNPGLLGERIERILRGGILREISRTRKITVGLCFLAAVVLAAACRDRSSYAGALKPDPKYTEQLAKQKAAENSWKAVQEMTPQQVADLEARINRNPEDLEARRKLIQFYEYKVRPKEGASSPSGAASAESEKMVAGLRSERLWFIEHHPENGMSAWASPVSDPAGERSAEKLWKAHISNPHAPPAVLWNAASFFQFRANDKPLAERLMLRAEAADGKSLAQTYNRNYIEGRMTKTEIWSPITSYYDNLAAPDSGLMYANTPWSGNYNVQSTIWVTAHTTQFARPGWRYIDSACGYLPGGGTYVTLVPPSSGDYTVVVETISATSLPSLKSLYIC